MIQKIKDYFWYEEGKISHFLSIGWGFDNTTFIFRFRITVFIRNMSLFDWQRYGTNIGTHVYWVGFSFRIRSIRQWRKSNKLMLFHFYHFWHPVYKHCSFISKEEIA